MSEQIKVFIAHASEDKECIRDIYSKLAAINDFKPWLDEIDLRAGQNWQIEIPKAIQECDVFLACLSRHSVRKQGYVQREFRLALNQYAEKTPDTTYLIPLKLDDCKIPDYQIPSLGVSLRSIQWLDFWKPNGFDRLVEAIKGSKPKHYTHQYIAFGSSKYEHAALEPIGNHFDVPPENVQLVSVTNIPEIKVELVPDEGLSRDSNIGAIFIKLWTIATYNSESLYRKSNWNELDELLFLGMREGSKVRSLEDKKRLVDMVICLWALAKEMPHYDRDD